jgi:uncharacterized repeat protein (TIGR03833 family)
MRGGRELKGLSPKACGRLAHGAVGIGDYQRLTFNRWSLLWQSTCDELSRGLTRCLKLPLAHPILRPWLRANVDQQYLIRSRLQVDIVTKQDQRSGRRTRGIVKDILMNSSHHPHGIKVRLETGEVGRVQEIVD